jgi:hypothetical protein
MVPKDVGMMRAHVDVIYTSTITITSQRGPLARSVPKGSPRRVTPIAFLDRKVSNPPPD